MNHFIKFGIPFGIVTNFTNINGMHIQIQLPFKLNSTTDILNSIHQGRSVVVINGDINWEHTYYLITPESPIKEILNIDFNKARLVTTKEAYVNYIKDMTEKYLDYISKTDTNKVANFLRGI